MLNIVISKIIFYFSLMAVKKWKQLMDTFRAELRKLSQKRSGDPGPKTLFEKVSQWEHFLSMMFI